MITHKLHSYAWGLITLPPVQWLSFGACVAATSVFTAQAAVDRYLTEVPDYQFYGGCFGTASGNLIGYWDRHGFPNFYTGPTAGGIAPLDSFGANYPIRSLWASKAGRDGRAADLPGHEDDYWDEFQSTAADPYLKAGRAEHTPDCIGDFIGLNQKKWQNMNGECDGNADGYGFVYWDPTGARRENFTPSAQAGLPATDIQCGLRAWTASRSSQADTFTQLTDVNPTRHASQPGFTFDDLKREIDAGYPVLVMLQDWSQNARTRPDMPKGNPNIHADLIFGYYIDDQGTRFIRFKTSWATGDAFQEWNAETWTPGLTEFLPARGVIGYHPLPRILGFSREGTTWSLSWEGPDAALYDSESGTTQRLHWYVVERSDSLAGGGFAPVGPPTTDRRVTFDDCCPSPLFLRVRLVPPPE